MAYQRFRDGFDIGTASAIDRRILLSREEMLNAEDVYELPEHYFTICTNDGKLYLYDASAPKDPVYGRYKEVNADLAERLGDVSSRVTALSDSLDELSDELDSEVASLSGDIDGVSTRLQTLSDDLISQINALNDELANKVSKDDLADEIPKALKEALSEQPKAGGLVVDSEGNIEVALDDNYLKLNDNNEITLADSINLNVSELDLNDDEANKSVELTSDGLVVKHGDDEVEVTADGILINDAPVALASDLPIPDGVTITEDSGGIWHAVGSSGTSNYNDLINKPLINNITLEGNKGALELGLQPTIGSKLILRAPEAPYDTLNVVSNLGVNVNSDYDSEGNPAVRASLVSDALNLHSTLYDRNLWGSYGADHMSLVSFAEDGEGKDETYIHTGSIQLTSRDDGEPHNTYISPYSISVDGKFVAFSEDLPVPDGVTIVKNSEGVWSAVSEAGNTLFRLSTDSEGNVILQQSDDGEEWSNVEGSAQVEIGEAEERVDALADNVAGVMADVENLSQEVEDLHEAGNIDFDNSGTGSSENPGMQSTNVQDAIAEAWNAIGTGGTGAAVWVNRLDEPGEGNVAAYQVTQGGKAVGASIDIPEFDAEALEDNQIPQAKVDGVVNKFAKLDEKDEELEERLNILDLPQEPKLIDNVLYANGVALRIIDDGTQNVAYYRTAETKTSKEEHTIPFPYYATVYGGAKGTAQHTFHFEASNIVIDGAKLHSVFGGCQDFGDVGIANIVMLGGHVRNSLMGGPNSFKAGMNASVGEVNIKVYDGVINMLYGGPASNTSTGKVNVDVFGGSIDYLTVGGSNGETLIGKLNVHGGNINVLQTVNRGYMEDAEVTVDGGTIINMYAGGEANDPGVLGRAEKVVLHLLGGNLTLHPGKYGGQEDLGGQRCSGDYNTGVITAAEAAAFEGRLVENCLILNCNL